MKLKNVFATAVIISSMVIGCKKKDVTPTLDNKKRLLEQLSSSSDLKEVKQKERARLQQLCDDLEKEINQELEIDKYEDSEWLDINSYIEALNEILKNTTDPDKRDEIAEKIDEWEHIRTDVELELTNPILLQKSKDIYYQIYAIEAFIHSLG